MKSKRIILDTNLWIYFLISRKLAEIDNHILKGNTKIITFNVFLEAIKKI